MTGSSRRWGVHSEIAAYRAAISELPTAVHATDDPAGSIVVVPGAGWQAGVLRAGGDGAVAVIVDEPIGPAGDLDVPLPVVIARRRMLALPELREPVAFVTVDVSGSAQDHPAALRDGLGLARRMVGGALQLEHARRTSHAVTAVLTAADGRPVAVTVADVSAPQGAGRLRVRGHGVEAIEALVDDAVGVRAVTVESGDGIRRLPAVHEAPARAALRAAVAAISAVESTLPDLAEARCDLALTTMILDTHLHRSE